MSEQPSIDLSNVSTEQLQSIQNAVLRQIAVRGQQGGSTDAVHDSHSSSHSKNSVVGDLALEEIVRSIGGQIRAPGQISGPGQ